MGEKSGVESSLGTNVQADDERSEKERIESMAAAGLGKSPDTSNTTESQVAPQVEAVEEVAEEVDVEEEALKLADMLVYSLQNDLPINAPAFLKYINEKGLDNDYFWALIEDQTVRQGPQGRLSTAELESFQKSIEAEKDRARLE